MEDMTSSRAPEPSSAQKDSFLVPFEFSDNTPLRSDGAAYVNLNRNFLLTGNLIYSEKMLSDHDVYESV